MHRIATPEQLNVHLAALEERLPQMEALPERDRYAAFDGAADWIVDNAAGDLHRDALSRTNELARRIGLLAF